MQGTVIEMKYALLSFGIPADTLPLDSDGKLIYGMFERHVKERRKLESTIKEQMESNNVVLCPTELDVLLGRGKPFQDFPGILRLNRLVDTYRPAYYGMARYEKTCTITSVIQLVHKAGGRFLRRCLTSSSPEFAMADAAADTPPTETKMDEGDHNDDGDGAGDATTAAASLTSPGTTTLKFLSTSGLSRRSHRSCFAPAPASGWEIVHDISIIHRKVNNVFKTRKSRGLWCYIFFVGKVSSSLC